MSIYLDDNGNPIELVHQRGPIEQIWEALTALLDRVATLEANQNTNTKDSK